MDVLVIGGTRFMGAELAFRWVCSGARVTLLNRGTRPDALGARVGRIRADRQTSSFEQALAGLRFDVVADFGAYTEADAARAVRALAGNVGHYIWISSGQVYLVRDSYVWPARESDYDGPVTPRPDTEPDQGEWDYGMGKRGAEDAFARAFEATGLPVTSLRLPMVIGPRDPFRRLDAYVYRLLDGGPLLLPDGGDAPARHVSSRAVATAMVAMAGRAKTFGRAYNLAASEVLSVRALVTKIAGLVGATPTLAAVTAADLARANLSRTRVSPFSNPWMSCLDPTRANLEWGFAHEPVDQTLARAVDSLVAHFPAEVPDGYDVRPREIALCGEKAAIRSAS